MALKEHISPGCCSCIHSRELRGKLPSVLNTCHSLNETPAIHSPPQALLKELEEFAFQGCDKPMPYDTAASGENVSPMTPLALNPGLPRPVAR